MKPGCALTVTAALLSACASVEEPTAQPPAAPKAAAVKPKTPAPPAPVVEMETAPEIPEPRPPVIVTKPSEVEALVGEFQRLRRLAPAEVVREQDVARIAFAQARSDNARVRYAMTLALPGSSPYDDSRALEVLEPLVRNPAATLHNLAVLLASYIQEQRRLGAQVQALQQKLDALKVLERSLSERGEGAARRR